MFDWKVEEMKLMQPESSYIGFREHDKRKMFYCESEVSREDKIAFVDKMQDFKLSYILSLEEKFHKEKVNLKKDTCGPGGVKTLSLKSWIRKNDVKKIMDNCFNYGNICFLNTRRRIYNLNHTNGYGYNDFVDEVFHQQLLKCYDMEKEYFEAHDEYSLLKKQFRAKKYDTTFGVHIGMWSDGRITVYDNKDSSKERDITIDELKDLLSKYKQLDFLVEKLTKETKIAY